MRMLTLLVALATVSLLGNVQAANFDCAQTTTSVEKLICADDDLSRLDEILDDAYRTVRARSDVVRDQRGWLRIRNACADTECIRRAYQDRLAELKNPKYRAPEAIASKSSGPSYFATAPSASIDVVINGCFSDAECESRLEKSMAADTASGADITNRALRNCLYSQRTMNICVGTWLGSLAEELQETVIAVGADARCKSRLRTRHDAWSREVRRRCAQQAFAKTGGGEATSGLESSCQIDFYQRAIVALWDSANSGSCKRYLQAFEVRAL